MFARSTPRLVSRALAALVTVALAACTDTPTAVVSSSVAPTPASASSNAGGAPKFWENLSSVYWNRTGRELLATTSAAGSVPVQARLFTYLSIAQYNAVVEAQNGQVRGDHPAEAAAVSAASAKVLKAFLPALSATIDARLAQQLAADPLPGEKSRDIDAGVAIGNQVATAVLAYASTDHFNNPAPPVPVTPGSWTGSNSVTTLYGARWFVLQNGEQVMPPAPPAFGSPAFNAALAEVASLAAGRTAEQRAIALYWAPRNGAAMNAVAADLIVQHHRNERDAARILALTNIASFDAINACFVAKFHYYYIRPTQANAGITLIPGLGLPNHPSYPSGHSCIVGSMTGVLANEFPSERAALDAMMEEAGLSRMYAGFHFRFDVDAGQNLGRAVANAVMQAAPAPRTPFALQ